MHLRHLVCTLIACILATSAATAQKAEPMFPVLTGPIVDAVDEIPAEREKALDGRLREFKRRTGHHLQIAIVPDLQGLDVETYANRLFRSWKLGRAGVDDGILLVHSPKERKVRIEVGYGAEPYLTDALSSRIMQQDIIPAFKEKRFADGIEAGADSLMREASITPEQRKEDAIKLARQRAIEAQRARDGFALFLWWVAGIAAAGAVGFGIYWMATSRRRAERRAAELLAEEESNRRAVEAAVAREEARQRAVEAERQRVEAARQRRQSMLDAMSPAERTAFLEEEARAAEHARQVAAAAESVRREEAARRRRIQEAEDRAEEERRAERRRQEERDAATSFGTGYGSSYGNSGSSSSSSSDSSSSWSGDGGSSGGGGASGDY
jgi:uncharacterized protein